ncbi:hypothetical protein PYW07_000311 [Mythimna separata]|uniref:Reverse transcriptase domain-containing protein n=1 Tax=Mythimna separata TaxID=271217 RepID=A0AAD7Z3S0_MYTSE|nr:hypothetical protein PYW07_000311 [Mythimna separata]
MAEECSSYVTNPSQQLKIITQNIRSIHANINSFLTLLCRMNVDCEILVLTECWLNRYNGLIPSIDQYTYYYTKNLLNQNDGVVLYVKNIKSYTVEEPALQDASCLLLKIGTDKAIICIYRSPSIRDISKFLQSLDSLLADLTSYKNIVIVGDLNIDIAYSPSSNQTSDYLDLIASHGMLPAHTLPTRETACLDHVMLKTNLSAVTIVLHSSVTDHAPVLLCLKLKTRVKPRPLTTSKTNFSTLDQAMITTDFQPIYQLTDANEAADCLITTLIRLLNNHTSTIKLPSNQRLIQPWMTMGMLRCIRNRDAMHYKLKQNPSNSVLSITYKRYRNFCTKILKKLKRDYDRTELREAANDSKKIWKIIKRVTYTETPNTPNTDLLNHSTSPKLAVERVNEFFASVGRNLAQNFSSPSGSEKFTTEMTSSPSTLQSFVMLSTDEAEVDEIITSLKTDSATGWDNISTKFLKRYTQILVPLLTHIFNICLNTGTFPRHFKKAIIHPIHKTGDTHCVNNYRPIAVLSSISKILERIVNKRLMKYLEDKKLLSPNQFGFRRGKSTSDAVTKLVDCVVKNIDMKQKVLSIFLDLKKAFDTVSIPNLLLKLEELGIRGKPLEFMKDYLQNRTQCVKIQEHYSRDAPVTFGVPQGSVLGPTLFLIYVNQLCDLKLGNGNIIAFADDTVLTFSGDSWHDTFNSAQKGLNTVLQWLKTHTLTLNTDKTKILTFSMRNSTQPSDTQTVTAHSCLLPDVVACTCPKLERCKTIKYLGVILDNGLSFAAHIETLTKRVRKLIFVVKTLRNVAEPQIMRCTYFALCQSLLNYCICAWGGAPKTLLLKLERAQRAVLKVSTFRPILFPTEELYKNCKVLTVRQLFVLNTVLLQHHITPYAIITTRRKDIISQPFRSHYSFTRRFPCFQGPHLYNKINKILNFNSLPNVSLKKKLSTWLQTLNYNNTELLLST